MNGRRVVLVGLALGILLNVLGVLGNGLLLRDAWTQAIPVRPAAAMQGWLSIVVSLGSDFVLGFGLVCSYAAVAPRLGPTFRTALCAAAVIWLIGVAVPYIGIVRIGWLPCGVTVATSVVAAVSFFPAAWITYRFYHDAQVKPRGGSADVGVTS